MNKSFGAWAFLIGIVLAVIFGAMEQVQGIMLTVLFIIGLVVGLLNITDKEATPFMMAGAVLVIVSALGGSVLSSIGWIKGILDASLAIFVPATVVVAVKSVFGMAKN